MNRELKTVLTSRFGFINDCEISIGDGWFPLVWNLCEDLEKLKLPSLKVAQVKEKFAYLRFYVDYGNGKAYDLIREAEKKSGSICEECGKPGCMRDRGGWLITACDKHAIDRGGKFCPPLKDDDDDDGAGV